MHAYLRGHIAVLGDHSQLRTWGAVTSTTSVLRDLGCVCVGGGVPKYNSIIKCTQVCVH